MPNASVHGAYSRSRSPCTNSFVDPRALDEKMESMKATLVSLSFALVACSHDPLGPNGGDNPGTGTGTILVTGTAHAASDTPNEAAETSFVTQYDFDLSINNVPVVAGTVTVTTRTTTTTLVGDNQGHWQGQAADYDPVYELNVVSGVDKISGVFVAGPDIHVFATPTAGASLDSTVANTTTWTRAAAAQEAVFSVGDVRGLSIPDTQSFSIPPGSLRGNPGQSTPNILRLTRTNSVVPKGGAPGSMVSVDVTQTLDVVALPCATC
jgi:hypothetical protein